jgi:hypothetical protein
MTSGQRLERDLPAILGDLAIAPYPDYIDDVLAATALRRQRPAWTVPERWLPMDLTTQRVDAPRVPWRALGALLLIALIIATALAVYVGSQPRRTPAAPFGPAANGSIVFAKDGDIYTADPVTGASKAIVVGDDMNSDPVFSPDGTRLAFGRAPASDQTARLLFVTDDAGGGLTQVTAEPVRDLNSWSFSPDGRSIVAFGSGATGLEVMVFATDGTTPPKSYPVFATRDDGAPQYRADGAEVMFIGREPGSSSRGVYGLDLVTGAVRPIVAPLAAPLDIHGANWSPDGRHVAYGEVDPTAQTASAQTHVIAIDGTGDVTIDTDPRSIADFGFAWSNDSTRIVVTRFYTDTKIRSVILPVDRSTPGVEIGCPPDVSTDDCSLDWTWSPDDSQLLGNGGADNAGAQFLADPLTGDIRVAPWTSTAHPAWQRLAP